MGKRELIDTGADNATSTVTDGRFKESDDVSRSLAADARRDAKNDARPGEGDKGDRKR